MGDAATHSHIPLPSDQIPAAAILTAVVLCWSFKFHDSHVSKSEVQLLNY